ncbi:MAG: cytochrome c [Acidobacteriota bacterium]|jgi:mono/diheme cytochrome c family protein
MVTENHPNRGIPRWVLYLIAIVVPAALAILIWQATPIVGGWGKSTILNPPAQSSSRDAQYAAPPSRQVLDPKALYRTYCATCHGANMQGGKMAPPLKRPDWPYGQHTDLLVNIIYQGKGLAMPSFQGRLSKQQMQVLAQYLQSVNGVKGS